MLFASTSDTVFAGNKINNKVYFYKNEVLIKSDILPPDNFDERKIWAFQLFKPYLKSYPSKITVFYNTQDELYKKAVSVSNIYIQSYLDKNISKENFIKSFRIELIDLKKEYSPVKTAIEPQQGDIARDINVEELKELAYTYKISGKYNEALRIYKQVSELNQYDYISTYWIGQIYQIQLDYKNALIYYKKTLDINPDFSSAKQELDWILSQNRG